MGITFVGKIFQELTFMQIPSSLSPSLPPSLSLSLSLPFSLPVTDRSPECFCIRIRDGYSYLVKNSPSKRIPRDAAKSTRRGRRILRDGSRDPRRDKAEEPLFTS